MFRDKDEELARLEEELLQEEAPEEAQESQQDDEPEFWEEPSGDTAEYHNFANDYGKPVRIYNADTADVDIDVFAEAVYNPPKPGYTGLLITILLLLAGIFLVLGWWAIRYLGVL